MAISEATDRPTADRSKLSETLRPLREATHLPSYIYTSKELFEREKEEIFMKDWLAVARVEEIEKPGDYMTFHIMGEPIVVARDRDGAINAFYNLCAHRGVEVIEGDGNAKQFKCPYHAWTYDLTGKLLGASYMDEIDKFDLDNCRMQSIHSDIW